MKKIIIATISVLAFTGCAMFAGVINGDYLFGSTKQLNASYNKETKLWTITATEPKTLTVSSKGDVVLVDGICKPQEVNYSLTCTAPVKVVFRADAGFSSTLTNDFGIVAGPMLKKAQ